MFVELLQLSVIKIDTLKKYYSSQVNTVESIMREDIEKNKFGFMIYLYFQSLLYQGKIKADVLKSAEKYAKKHVNILEINKEKNYVKFSFIDPNELAKKYETNIKKAKIEFMNSVELENVFSNSLIVMILIRFEEFISDLFKILINNFPDAYISDKQVKYIDIVKMNNDNIIKLFVDQEVNEIMRQNIDCWLNLLKKHGVNCDCLKPYFDEFKELYLRRNIIVHNSSRVNKEYLNGVCDKFKTGVKIGDQLVSDKKYIYHSLNLTYIMIYGIVLSMYKIEDDKTSLKDLIFNLGFDHMNSNDWIVSEFIYSFLYKLKDQQEVDKITSKINYWISVKNSKGLDSINDEIEGTDFSATKVIFLIARLILLNKYDDANRVLEENITVFPASCFEQWPLFIQYRESEQYKELRKNHASYFDIQQVDIDDQNKLAKEEVAQITESVIQ